MNVPTLKLVLRLQYGILEKLVTCIGVAHIVTIIRTFGSSTKKIRSAVMFLLTHNSWNYKQLEKFKTQTLFCWTSHQCIAHLELDYTASTERFP